MGESWSTHDGLVPDRLRPQLLELLKLMRRHHRTRTTAGAKVWSYRPREGRDQGRKSEEGKWSRRGQLELDRYDLVWPPEQRSARCPSSLSTVDMARRCTHLG